MTRTYLFFLIVFYTVLSGFAASAAVDASKNLKQLFFEERKIEGKIRRPQLVLIKAEQRPEFEPMVIQSLGKTGNIAGSVDKRILDQSPYDGAFEFRDKKIVNYVP